MSSVKKATELNKNKDPRETTGITASLILEVLGKPAEYLNEALDGLITRINGEKGVRVLNKKINEPILIKDQKEFYSNFAEVEVEVEDILYLAVLMFKYMPSHIEVISPELIALTNSGWNDILNELTRRLHGYDEVARVLQAQQAQMQRKINELTGNTKEKKEN